MFLSSSCLLRNLVHRDSLRYQHFRIYFFLDALQLCVHMIFGRCFKASCKFVHPPGVTPWQLRAFICNLVASRIHIQVFTLVPVIPVVACFTSGADEVPHTTQESVYAGIEDQVAKAADSAEGQAVEGVEVQHGVSASSSEQATGVSMQHSQ